MNARLTCKAYEVLIFASLHQGKVRKEKHTTTFALYRMRKKRKKIINKTKIEYSYNAFI